MGAAKAAQKRGSPKKSSAGKESISYDPKLLRISAGEMSSRIPMKEKVFYGFLMYFIGVFVVNFFSKGLSENLLLSPVQAADFLGEQILTLVRIPVVVANIVGFLLTSIFFFFGYTISEEIKSRVKRS
jgi:hypothetical protein